MLYRQLSNIISIIWGSIVVWMSLTSSPPSFPKGFFGWDKFLHFSAYSVLSFFICSSLCFSEKRGNRVLLISVLLSAGTGLILELMQYLMHNGRTFENLDIVANTAGSFAGTLSALLMFKSLYGKKWICND